MITDEDVSKALAAFNKAINEPVMLKCERCEGRGYHHGFGETGHDPDWCDVCGGNQYNVAPGEEERAMRIALEAALTPSAGEAEPVAWRWKFDEDAEWHYGDRKPTGFRFGDPDIIEPLFSSPSASEAQVRVKHKKRGTEYEVLGVGKMQAEDWFDHNNLSAPSVDHREVVVYRSVDDGSIWVRPREEFEDGRFEALSTPEQEGTE